MYKISLVGARKGLARMVKMVSGDERVVIFRHKKPAAVLVSVEDDERRRAAEDRADVEAAREAMEEPGSIPWERVKADLEL